MGFFQKLVDNYERRPMLKFQQMRTDGSTIAFSRTAVPGGWILFTATAGGAIATTFIPDADHKWNGNSLEPPTAIY